MAVGLEDLSSDQKDLYDYFNDLGERTKQICQDYCGMPKQWDTTEEKDNYFLQLENIVVQFGRLTIHSHIPYVRESMRRASFIQKQTDNYSRDMFF